MPFSGVETVDWSYPESVAFATLLPSLSGGAHWLPLAGRR